MTVGKYTFFCGRAPCVPLDKYEIQAYVTCSPGTIADTILKV